MAPLPALTFIVLVTLLLSPTQSQLVAINNAGAGQNPFEQTGDWIPMRQPCPTCVGQQLEDQLSQKSGRVLNTAAFQRNLFPGHQSFREQIIPAQSQRVIQQPQAAALIQPNPNLTPQFLPHLEQAKFNPQHYQPQSFQPQYFLQPQPQQQLQQIPQQPQQFLQQPQFYQNLQQPHDDFQLLQQILNNPNNQQFVEPIYNFNQSQIQSFTFTPVSTTTPKATTTKVATDAPQQQNHPAKPNEEVQLLYVPLETLRQRSPQKQLDVTTEQMYQPQLDFHKQAQLQSIQRDYAQQNAQALQLQQQFQQSLQLQPVPQQQNQIVSSSTSPKPIISTAAPPKKKPKLKPHQPPLAVFMGTENKEDVKVNDVLTLLSSARTISVLDQVSPKMPKVFVGPSNLQPPSGYAKFDLPYLSNLDNNRIQRKVEQLPFFVAPLSYNVPDGYSKIPFPSPHIGSVVIRDMKELHTKPDLNDIYQPSHTPIQQSVFEPVRKPNHQYVTNHVPSSTAAPLETFGGKYYTRGSVSTVVTSTTPNNYYYSKTPSTPPPSTDYTVLEQFPIRQQTSTNVYSNLDLSKYRTNPLGINEEFGGLFEYQQPSSIRPPITQQSNRHQQPSSVRPPITSTTHLFEYQQPSSARPPISSTLPPLMTSQKYNPFISVSSTTKTPLNYYTTPSTTEQPSYIQQFITPSTTEQPQYIEQYATPSTTERPSIIKQYNPTSTTTESGSQYEFDHNSYQPSPPGQYYQPPIVENQYQQIYNQQFAQINTQNPHYQTIPNYQLQNPSTPQQEVNIPPITTTELPIPFPETNSSTYNLSPELPPINPNLPGLVNSLESMDTTSEASSQRPMTETPTRRPIASRTRQRTKPVQSPTTTSTTQRTPTQRRRRPYNGKPRPEYEKYLTTTEPPVVEITTPRRSRFEYTTSTTEAPKRNTNTVTRGSTNTATRGRFRSRGRPTTQQPLTTVKPDDMLSSSTIRSSSHVDYGSVLPSSTEHVENPSFQQPQFESGFQVSPPFMTQAQPVQTHHQEQYLTEQHPVYQHNPVDQVNYAPNEETTPSERPSSKRPIYRQPVQDSEVISEPVGDDSDFVRFNGGTPQQVAPAVQTSSPVRSRSRVRSRGRPLQHQQLQQHQQQQQQQQQHQQSVARISTSTEPTAQPVADDYYGFIRMPNYQQEQYYSQPDQYYSQTERSSTESADTVYVQGSGNTSPSSIAYPNNEVVSEVAEVTTETPTTKSERFARPTRVYTVRPPKRIDEGPKVTKIRGRIRKPTTSPATVEDDYSVKPLQNRGHTHFQPRPGTEVDDVSEGENYPKGYLETQTKTSDFKISVAPYDDQITYQSINRPKKVIAQNPEDGGSESQWGSKYTTTYFRKNNNLIATEDKEDKETPAVVEQVTVANTTTDGSKSIFEQIFEEMAKFGSESTTTETATTEESIGEIKVTKGKKRGFWKRVRVRPVDGLETAESQNIGNTINLISDSAKLTHPAPTVEQYKITFEADNETVTELPEVADLPTTVESETELPPTVVSTYHQPEETTDIFASLFNILEQNVTSEEVTTVVPEITTMEPTTVISTEATDNQLNETKIISEKIKEYTDRVEEEEKLKEIKDLDTSEKINEDHAVEVKEDKKMPFVVGTSTSTEISHETEICYRGRCIKSTDAVAPETPEVVAAPTEEVS